MAKNKVVATYDYYTLDQARNILIDEVKKDYKRKLVQKRRKERFYYLKQKCIGLIILLATIILYLVSKDIFACLPFFCMGIACFTRLHLIYD